MHENKNSASETELSISSLSCVDSERGKEHGKDSENLVQRKCSCLFHREGPLPYPAKSRQGYCTGELVGNETYHSKLLHEVQSFRESEARNQQSGARRVQLLNEEMAENVSSMMSYTEYQPSSANGCLRPEFNEGIKAVHLSDDTFRKVSVMKWTTDDVVSWLESVGMEKFSPAFKAQNITGQDVASIDMELLDSLGISSIQDRELILSRLYELQHPDSGSGHVAQIKGIFQQIPSFESDRESDVSSNGSRKMSFIGEEKQHIDDNIVVRSLKIWHDVKGHPVDTTVMVTSQMTSHDVIVSVLNENDVMDEPSLFTLTRVTMDSNTGEVCTFDLTKEDYPSVIHQTSQKNPEIKARLELRSNKTHQVKVIYDMDEEITTFKMFDVSTMCTCGELLSIAASAYCFPDVSQYCLQAISDKEISQEVGTTKLLLLYNCKTYKMMEKQETVEITRKSSADQLEGISNRKSRIWQKDHSSESRFGKKVSHQEDLSELREGLIEKDKIICQLQLENEAYQVDRRQAHDLRSLFSVMEREMKRGQADLLNKYKMLDQQLSTIRNKSSGILGHEDEVDILQHILIVTSQQIQLVEQRERLLQTQLVTAQANLRPDPLVIQHLKYQLSDTDFCLLDLKQQQADIYRQLKMARRQLAKMYKTAVDPDRFSIFKLIQELGYSPSILHQVVTLNLDMSSNKCDFILGHDSHSRPVVKHADENSSLQKGDHIIEINGASVTHFNESELSKQLLQAASNLCIVVLRKTTNCELKIQEKTEEAESIREDLSLTMIELESIQDENRDIKSELERVSVERIQLQEKNSDLEAQREEIHTQFEQHRQEVQAQIKQFQEQLQKKEKEIQDLKNQVSGPASGLKAALQGLSRKSSILSQLSDGGIKTTINGGPVDSANELHNGDKVLSYEAYGEVPIWQSLQMAPKGDILQALKDQVLENQQQKSYLDHLLTAVIDNAPNLVQVVDQGIGILDQNALDLKARSEEFC
ncbi:hypothetical protein LSH36_55g07015 [Paralvinella palmiformis]|uniref:SAM domain-containing protein n=1 Tax=Paralvinella palmiformis TaxID=53620 RepID=A0AAD9NDZ8_9ANNE|nr:hypothetical protein LSH36_55g07015 [Paralvinella palmiformis]